VGNAQWVQIQTSAPTPSRPTPSQRTGHTVITYKDNLYVFGGTDGQYHYNDTWEYNTQTGKWTELSCSGYIPVAREGHAATLVDDVMYVFAGRGVDGKDLEDLAAFKITGAENVARRWFMFQHMGPTPSGRSGHAMSTWQSKVYVLGGESYSSAQPGYDPNFVNILDTCEWAAPLQLILMRETPIHSQDQVPSAQIFERSTGSTATDKPAQAVFTTIKTTQLAKPPSQCDSATGRATDTRPARGVENAGRLTLFDAASRSHQRSKLVLCRNSVSAYELWQRQQRQRSQIAIRCGDGSPCSASSGSDPTSDASSCSA
jgi:hypothetical protein